LFAGKGEDLLDLFVVGLHGGRGKWVLWEVIAGACHFLVFPGFAKFLNGSFEKLPAGEGEKEALLCCGCCWTSTPTMVDVGTIANIRCLSSWVLCEFVEKESFH
jgi:hypothetical protein